MASLNTLRTKGSIAVTIVIFVALLAFLIGDIFTSGSTLFNSRKTRVGDINGKHINYVDFLNEADYLTSIYKMMWGRDAFSAQEQEMIYDMAWEQLIMENSFKPGFDNLGLTVSETEQRDMLDGVYLSPIVTSTFINPSTGLFDPQMLKTFMGSAATNDGAYAIWSFLRNQMQQERAVSKYMTLVKGGYYANALEIAHGMETTDVEYSANVVGKDYFTVPDSLVNITSADVKKYYDTHKEAFRQAESRNIEYVVFDVMPSESDYADAKKMIDGIAEEFAVSDAPMQYATLNSQTKPDVNYYSQEQLSDEIAALAFGNDTKGKVGPTLDGDEYTISRVANIRMMPDSLGARHIMLQRRENKLADSLVTVIRNGGDFAELAMQYSLDRSAAQNGGDLGRFTPAQVPAEFTDAAIAAKVGDVYVVESNVGLQVVELTYKSRPVKKAQIATITYKVDPSDATVQTAYQKASSFVTSAGNTVEGFDKAVNDAMLSKRTVRILNTDRTISGIENSKEMVRWAFNGKAGDISQIMDIDGDYYVAALVDVREQGYTALEQATPQITQILRNEAKARIIADEMTGNTIDEVAAATGEDVQAVDGVQWNAFYIPEVGVEPQLIGAISNVEEGILSKPVEGVNGVYRFVVTGSEKTGDVDAESERVRINANASAYVQQRAMQALNEESDIKDMRVKFF